MGHQRVHESAGLWTIYHAIDSETADPFQAYQATRYVDTEIPHIPVRAEGLDDEYATISTTNWLPYSWSVNNVAFAEVMHTALAYFQAGRSYKGYRLLKGSILDGMYLGDSPGNFGQISFYDAARGECYRDFGDPVGVASRVLVQGLFGIIPDAMNEALLIRPGYPVEWANATISTPNAAYDFCRKGKTDYYTIKQQLEQPLTVKLQVNAPYERIQSVKVNGKSANWKKVEAAAEYPVILIEGTNSTMNNIEICWSGDLINSPKSDDVFWNRGDEFVMNITPNQSILSIYDPQQVLTDSQIVGQTIKGVINGRTGGRTVFVELSQGDMQWWQPIHINVASDVVNYEKQFSNVVAENCEMIDIQPFLNASVTDIYENQYLSPRSPYTTLQIPTQGIGEWCHPLLSADIDDTGLRALAINNQINTSLNVPFATPQEGNNILFTSLWDNYPNETSIPLTGKASRAYLLMAGSTNHMQCHIVNGVITVKYKDGSTTQLELINPDRKSVV